MSEIKKAIVIMAKIKSYDQHMPVAFFEFKENNSIHLSYNTCNAYSIRIENFSTDKIIDALKFSNILVTEYGEFLSTCSNIITIDKLTELYDCVYVRNIFELNIEITRKICNENLNISNLRMIYKTLSTNILGEGYYNMACDVITCDQIMYDDIMRKINRLKMKNKISSVSCIFLWIIIALLIFVIFLILAYYN